MNALRRAWRWLLEATGLQPRAFIIRGATAVDIKGVNIRLLGEGWTETSPGHWRYNCAITITDGPFAMPNDRHQWMGWEEEA